MFTIFFSNNWSYGLFIFHVDIHFQDLLINLRLFSKVYSLLLFFFLIELYLERTWNNFPSYMAHGLPQRQQYRYQVCQLQLIMKTKFMLAIECRKHFWILYFHSSHTVRRKRAKINFDNLSKTWPLRKSSVERHCCL